MKEIILVGNGSSMLDKKNSYEIDSYKKVVRFNSFKIKGYEDYVGTKTNIWFTVNKAHIDRIHDFDEQTKIVDELDFSWATSDVKEHIFITMLELLRIIMIYFIRVII